MSTLFYCSVVAFRFISILVNKRNCSPHKSTVACRYSLVLKVALWTSWDALHLHLADAFIQSVLQCIQAMIFYQYVCSLGIEPTTFCAANAMLYH